MVIVPSLVTVLYFYLFHVFYSILFLYPDIGNCRLCLILLQNFRITSKIPIRCVMDITVNKQNHYFIYPNKVTIFGKCIQVIDELGYPVIFYERWI